MGGEIDKPVVSQSVSVDSPSKSTSPKSDAVFVVGLEKTGSRLGRPPNTPNRYPRVNTPRRPKDGILGGPYKCPGCDGVAFSNRRSLELHMKRMHKAGIMECDECGRKVLDLKRHKEILHKRFKIFDCPHCNDKFCTQDDLERHLAKVEKNNMVTGGSKKHIIRPKPLVEVTQRNQREEEEKKQPEEPLWRLLTAPPMSHQPTKLMRKLRHLKLLRRWSRRPKGSGLGRGRGRPKKVEV